MGKAGKLDLIIEQGITFEHTLVWTRDGVIIPLTNYTARMQIRETIDGPIIKTLSTVSGGITITGALGQIQLYISASNTAALTFTTAVYDLELTSPDNPSVITRLVKGVITLERGVTR